MSLLEKIRQIRLCLPAFTRGSCVYLLAASPHRITAERDYPFLFCSAVKKCCRSLSPPEYEPLTSPLISICERKEKFSMFLPLQSLLLKDSVSSGASQHFRTKRECSTNLTQQAHSKMKRGGGFLLSHRRC